MSWSHESWTNWRRGIPSWAAWTLAAALLGDAFHFSMRLRATVAEQSVPPTGQSRRVKVDPSQTAQQIISAHLFGSRAPEELAEAGSTDVPLALSGVIAMDNPADGYAILGKKDHMHVYRVGSKLPEMPAGRLAQVLGDRVVLALAGGVETLTLPRRLLPDTTYSYTPVQVAMADANGSDDVGGHNDAEAAAVAQAARLARMDSLPADKQRWLAVVSADPDAVTAQGIAVHPNPHYQRQYGLHDGDVVTAINGVPITNADALDNALQSSSATMQLTFVHDGAAQTTSVPTDQ